MRCLDDVDERGDVVIGDRARGRGRLDERLVDDRGPIAAGLGVGRRARRRARRGPRWRAARPRATREAVDVGPHRGHLRRGVARDHRGTARSGSRRARRRRRPPAPGRRPALDQLDERPRLGGQRPASRTVAEVGAPPGERRVHRLDLGPARRTGRGSARRVGRRAVVGAHLDRRRSRRARRAW